MGTDPTEEPASQSEGTTREDAPAPRDASLPAGHRPGKDVENVERLAIEPVFEPGKELAEVAYRGIDHSTIHNLPSDLNGLVMHADFLLPPGIPSHFTETLSDPRPRGSSAAWDGLGPDMQLQVIRHRVDELMEGVRPLWHQISERRNAGRFEREEALALYSNALEKTTELLKIGKSLPLSWQRDEMATDFLRIAERCSQLIEAQVAILSPSPTVVATDLGTIARRAYHYVTEGMVASIPPGFVHIGTIDPAARIALAHGVLLERTIMELVKNSFDVAFRRQVTEFFAIRPELVPSTADARKYLLLATAANLRNVLTPALAGTAPEDLEARLEDLRRAPLKAEPSHVPGAEALTNFLLERIGQFRVTLHVRPLGDGHSTGYNAIVTEDNCGGFPAEDLKPDSKGISTRLRMCNRQTSSKGGGIGTSEAYWAVEGAMGGRFLAENYAFDAKTQGARTILGLRASA